MNSLRQGIAFIMLLLASSIVFGQVNVQNVSIETSALKIRYAACRPSGCAGFAMTEFTWKKYSLNLANMLDCMGYGYALYIAKGPTKFTQTADNAGYLEVSEQWADNGNDPRNGNPMSGSVTKSDRVYKNVPVLEINYSQMNLLWWEDIGRSENSTLAIYGISADIPEATFKQYQSCAKNKNGGEPFGTDLVVCAGSTTAACTYKNYRIHGNINPGTNRGIGFVTPVSVGWKDFKFWDSYSYEQFPAIKSNFKRWMFAFEGGRTGLMTMGQQIVDNGGPLTGTAVSGRDQQNSFSAYGVARRSLPLSAGPDRLFDIRGRQLHQSSQSSSRKYATGIVLMENTAHQRITRVVAQ